MAVLGYSSRRDGELHAICRARLEHAAREAAEGDAVVLSGGRHRALGRPEADAMLEAWPGSETAVVRESAALTTAENAAHVRAVALGLGVREVVVVTSRWHSPRAAALFRRAFRGTGVRVSAAPARPGGRRHCSCARRRASVALPVQLHRVDRAVRDATGPTG